MDFVDDYVVDSEEQDFSTHFPQTHKNQIFNLQDHFERYCNVLSIFGLNRGK